MKKAVGVYVISVMCVTMNSGVEILERLGK